MDRMHIWGRTEISLLIRLFYRVKNIRHFPPFSVYSARYWHECLFRPYICPAPQTLLRSLARLLPVIGLLMCKTAHCADLFRSYAALLYSFGFGRGRIL